MLSFQYIYILKAEMANVHMFCANGKWKTEVFFLGRQTINNIRRLLFQQTCLYMSVIVMTGTALSAMHSGRQNIFAPLPPQ